MEYDESAEETAVRELEEETNIVASSSDLVLFDTWQQERPDENVYSVTVGYAVSLPETTGKPKAGTDAEAVQFWQLEGDMNGTLRPGEERRMKRAIEAV